MEDVSDEEEFEVSMDMASLPDSLLKGTTTNYKTTDKTTMAVAPQTAAAKDTKKDSPKENEKTTNKRKISSPSIKEVSDKGVQVDILEDKIRSDRIHRAIAKSRYCLAQEQKKLSSRRASMEIREDKCHLQEQVINAQLDQIKSQHVKLSGEWERIQKFKDTLELCNFNRRLERSYSPPKMYHQHTPPPSQPTTDNHTQMEQQQPQQPYPNTTMQPSIKHYVSTPYIEGANINQKVSGSTLAYNTASTNKWQKTNMKRRHTEIPKHI